MLSSVFFEYRLLTTHACLKRLMKESFRVFSSGDDPGTRNTGGLVALHILS